MPRLAIIGGGFTGAALAVHLARAGGPPIEIAVIEPGPTIGGGVAYGLAAPEHRINVPADRMTVFREKPDDFACWLAANGRDRADPDGWTPAGDHYSRRLDFGAYMADLFEREAMARPDAGRLYHRRARALHLAPLGQGWRIALDDGTSLDADAAVMTASHGAPAFRWPLTGDAARHPGLIRDPWSPACLSAIPPTGAVFVIGTGLTMADTVVSLRRRGHRGPILAVSRRALLPRPHGLFGTGAGFPEPYPVTAVETLRMVRRLVRAAEKDDLGWHPAIDAFRGALRRLWPGLSVIEQDRALRHLRAWWDVHRYRIAPQVADLLAAGQRDGWLRVAAGRLEGVETGDAGLVARWTPRGGRVEAASVAAVVNCTGPDADPSRSPAPLFQALLAEGVARPDRHRLGLDIDAEGRVVGADGRSWPRLFIAGPLGRGRLGEVMGVPEASDHAREIAGRIAPLLFPAPAS